MAERTRQGQVAESRLDIPLYLKEKQNFYHQPPFKKVLEGIARYTAKEYPVKNVSRDSLINGFTSDYAHIITQFAAKIAERKTKRFIISGVVDFFLDDLIQTYLPESRKKFYSKHIPQAEDGMKVSLFGALEQLHGKTAWIPYVAGQLDESFYKPDGTPVISKKQTFIAAPTYEAWIVGRNSTRYNIEKNTFESVVQETFPQELASANDRKSILKAWEGQMRRTRGFNK